jgi:hypothetical protein
MAGVARTGAGEPAGSGRGRRFDAYVAGLRTTHKRRRKLLEMLDRFTRRAAVRA